MTIWQPDISHRREPKYMAIANVLETDIRNGVLQPGQPLPTHRDLADTLGLTVGTVTRAYAEAERRGLVRGETGRGTFVARDVRTGGTLIINEDLGPGFIDLSLACTVYSEDPDLRSTLRGLADQPGLERLLEYQPSRGMPRHREAGAQWVRQYGITATPEHILVTAGAQHALTVLLLGLFKPGDRIVTEALTYPGFKSLASQLQLRLVPVPMDAEGLIPEELEAACAKSGVKGLYTMPSLHNPTNACLSEARRQAVASIAQKHNLWIIEDDCYALAVPDAPAPLHTLSPDRTFFIAGTSKLLAGGLRVAYLVAPRHSIKNLSLAITTTTWMASPLMAEIASRWIQDGTAERVMHRKRNAAAERNAIAAEHFEGFSFQSRPTSYFIWLNLPDQWTGEEFERATLKRGVGVATGERFLVGQEPLPNACRVSLCAPRTSALLEKALKIIADILRGFPGPPGELI